jgi:hypothetical protein
MDNVSAGIGAVFGRAGQDRRDAAFLLEIQ